jgi:hypothetical protein
MSTTPSPQADLTQHKREEIDRANESGRTAVGLVPAVTIDSGWREVADTALEFLQRFV